MSSGQLPWFRLWNQTLDNVKVQSLPGNKFKLWINTLCHANKQNPRGMIGDIEQYAFALRISESKARSLLEFFVAKKLVDEQNSEFFIHDWEDFQPKSDSSSDRVAKHRAKKINGESNNNNGLGDDCNVTSSVTETILQQSSNVIEQRERRTDTEKNRTERECVTVSSEQFQWATDWLKQNKLDGVVCLSLVADKFVNYWSARDKPPKDLAAKWRQWVMNETPGKPGKTPTAEVIPMQQKDYQAGATKLEDMPDWMRQAASEVMQ